MKTGSSPSAIYVRFPSRWLEILWVIHLAWLSVSNLFPVFRPPGILFFCLFGLTVWRKAFHLWPTLFLFGLWHWLPLILSEYQYSSLLAFILPILISLPMILLLKKRYFDWSWLKKGEIDSVSTLLIILVSILSSASLILWASSTNNLGAGLGLVKDLENIPKSFLLLIGVPIFSLIVALVEEVMFRGVLQHYLLKCFPEYIFSGILFQSLVFASSHYANGFPNGSIGFVLAFIFGSALGYLRWRTGGIFASFLGHFFTDIIIGIVLTVLAR
jgi:membrane protease YdiL (CAAX protease family)